MTALNSPYSTTLGSVQQTDSHSYHYATPQVQHVQTPYPVQSQSLPQVQHVQHLVQTQPTQPTYPVPSQSLSQPQVQHAQQVQTSYPMRSQSQPQSQYAYTQPIQPTYPVVSSQSQPQSQQVQNVHTQPTQPTYPVVSSQSQPQSQQVQNVQHAQHVQTQATQSTYPMVSSHLQPPLQPQLHATTYPGQPHALPHAPSSPYSTLQHQHPTPAPVLNSIWNGYLTCKPDECPYDPKKQTSHVCAENGWYCLNSHIFPKSAGDFYSTLQKANWSAIALNCKHGYHPYVPINTNSVYDHSAIAKPICTKYFLPEGINTNIFEDLTVAAVAILRSWNYIPAPFWARRRADVNLSVFVPVEFDQTKYVLALVDPFKISCDPRQIAIGWNALNEFGIVESEFSVTQHEQLLMSLQTFHAYIIFIMKLMSEHLDLIPRFIGDKKTDFHTDPRYAHYVDQNMTYSRSIDTLSHVLKVSTQDISFKGLSLPTSLSNDIDSVTHRLTYTQSFLGGSLEQTVDKLSKRGGEIVKEIVGSLMHLTKLETFFRGLIEKFGIRYLERLSIPVKPWGTGDLLPVAVAIASNDYCNTQTQELSAKIEMLTSSLHECRKQNEEIKQEIAETRKMHDELRQELMQLRTQHGLGVETMSGPGAAAGVEVGASRRRGSISSNHGGQDGIGSRRRGSISSNHDEISHLNITEQAAGKNDSWEEGYF